LLNQFSYLLIFHSFFILNFFHSFQQSVIKKKFLNFLIYLIIKNNTLYIS